MESAGGGGAPLDASEVDRVLAVLLSADNAARVQAEAQLEQWSQHRGFLRVLMQRSHMAPTPASRQLAATVLSWRIPRLWPNLSDDDRLHVRSSLLDCCVFLCVPTNWIFMERVVERAHRSGLVKMAPPWRNLCWPGLLTTPILRRAGRRSGDDFQPHA